VITASGTNRNGREVVVLGLDRETVEKLLSRQPVVVEDAELGRGFDLTLLYSDTDEELKALFFGGQKTEPDRRVEG
jgi:hypothetical protein